MGQPGAQSHPGCVRASQRWRNPSQGPRGPTLRALLLARKGNGQAAPGSPSFLHSKQTRHEQTKQSLARSPLLPSRGGSKKAQRWMSPDFSRYVRSHALKATTHRIAVGSSKKPNHNSRSSFWRMTHALWAAGQAPRVLTEALQWKRKIETKSPSWEILDSTARAQVGQPRAPTAWPGPSTWAMAPRGPSPEG